MNNRRLTRNYALLILGVIFAAYCLFQARFLILGPRVSIKSHENDSVLQEPVITLSGTANNAAWLSLNGRQIFTDEEGLWSEKLILLKGVSIMTLTARDRFGRESEKSVRLILN